MTKQLTLEQLKRKIARLPMTSTGSRRRYPDELKEAMVTLAAEYKLRLETLGASAGVAKGNVMEIAAEGQIPYQTIITAMDTAMEAGFVDWIW